MMAVRNLLQHKEKTAFWKLPDESLDRSPAGSNLLEDIFFLTYCEQAYVTYSMPKENSKEQPNSKNNF